MLLFQPSETILKRSCRYSDVVTRPSHDLAIHPTDYNCSSSALGPIHSRPDLILPTPGTDGATLTIPVASIGKPSTFLLPALIHRVSSLLRHGYQRHQRRSQSSPALPSRWQSSPCHRLWPRHRRRNGSPARYLRRQDHCQLRKVRCVSRKSGPRHQKSGFRRRRHTS